MQVQNVKENKLNCITLKASLVTQNIHASGPNDRHADCDNNSLTVTS
jgi:hypothetical protein